MGKLLRHRLICRTPLKFRKFLRLHPPHFFVYGKLWLARRYFSLYKHERKLAVNASAILPKRLYVYAKLLPKLTGKALERRFARLGFAAGKLPQMSAGAVRAAAYQYLSVAADYCRGNFSPYPTTSLLVFLRYFAGIGLCSRHVMFIGFEPVDET